MFFSRTRPTLEKVQGMLLGVCEKTPAAVKRPARVAQPGDQSPAAPLINDVKEVPHGKYWSFGQKGVSQAFSESFAVLLAGETSAIVLVSPEAFSTHPQFELCRRVKEAGFRSITIRRATREIIRVVHDNNRSETDVSPASTNTESIARSIVDDAIEMNASDIHIETRGSYAQVFYRIHGQRIEQPSIATQTAFDVCNVLYSVHADADNKGLSWDPKMVMNTVIEHTSKSGDSVQLRFSSGPIHPSGNFHAVIRLLVMDKKTVRPLEDVGYTDEQVAAIEEMLIGSQGMVLLVGPTNSGKSTSMQSFLQRIYDRRGKDIKVLTVEDPVEYVVPDACQMGVPQGRKGLEDRLTGSVYTTFLKGTLRQDPDVVMVGEIRDRESAESVKDLVLAGRKLLSTLHAYEAFAVFARLREIGVPPSVLYMSGFVSGVIYQRLVPILCPECSIPIMDAMEQGRIRKPTFDRVLRVADFGVHNVRARGNGCEHCNHVGIIGRTPCAEILVPDSVFLELLAQGKDAEARQYWMSRSGIKIEGLGVTAVAHAIHKMREGILDPSEIESQIGILAAAEQYTTQNADSSPVLPPSLNF